MQLGFGDAECLGQREQIQRERIPAGMYQVVPWKRVPALIDPHFTGVFVRNDIDCPSYFFLWIEQ